MCHHVRREFNGIITRLNIKPKQQKENAKTFNKPNPWKTCFLKISDFTSFLNKYAKGDMAGVPSPRGIHTLGRSPAIRAKRQTTIHNYFEAYKQC